MQSLRYALRGLARRPAFTCVAIVTLALGIGANAAIFSAIYAVLIRPLPYRDADRIVMPWEYSAEVQQRLGFDRLPSSAGDYFDFSTRNATLESLASMRTERINLTGGGDPERVGAVRVTTRFFDVLGVNAEVGRTFVREDEARGRVVVIAHNLWQRRFAGDPAIAGRAISINGETATVVGVAPPSFEFPAAGELPEGFGFSSSPAIWTLDVLTPEQQGSRGGKSRALIGRLKPGVSLLDAQRDLAGIAASIAEKFPQSNAGWTVRVIPLREQLVGRMRPSLMVLLMAVGFVLLIACANVTNLLLVHAASRQRELCIRRALGAGHWVIVQQFLVESLVLAALAGTAGLLLAWSMLRLLVTLLPPTLVALGQVRLDWRVTLFTAGVSLGTAVVFSLMPAWQCTRYDTAEGLREGARGTVGSRRSHRTRNVLVIVEVALAVVLLIGALLLVQTFVRLIHVETGFETDRILTVEIALPRSLYPPPRMAAFFEALVRRVSGLPGVAAAGVTSGLPLAGLENLSQVTVEGRPRPAPGHDTISDYRVVTPGYFRALGIPLVAGTPLPDDARADGPPVILINETMARTLWPGENALGRRLKVGNYDRVAPWLTVLGIVGDTRQSGLTSPLRPQVYVHHVQDPSDHMAVVLRTTGDPLLLVAPTRAAVLAIDPNQPIGSVRTMAEIVSTSVSDRRFHMFLVGVFAVLAVALSLIGLYGIVSYSVAERIQEMAVRLALGARPADLLRLVLVEGLTLTSIGIAVGMIAAFGVTRVLEASLFGVNARDVTTFVAVPLILLIAALLGCLAPARRAMRVDPSAALRLD